MTKSFEQMKQERLAQQPPQIRDYAPVVLAYLADQEDIHEFTSQMVLAWHQKESKAASRKLTAYLLEKYFVGEYRIEVMDKNTGNRFWFRSTKTQEQS